MLAPLLADDHDYAIDIGAKPENLRTWSKGSVSYTVVFIPVPTDQVKISQQAFDAAVNELLDEKLSTNRHSRCLIPLPDGTKKVCPKNRMATMRPAPLALTRTNMYERTRVWCPLRL